MEKRNTILIAVGIICIIAGCIGIGLNKTASNEISTAINDCKITDPINLIELVSKTNKSTNLSSYGVVFVGCIGLVLIILGFLQM